MNCCEYITMHGRAMQYRIIQAQVIAVSLSKYHTYEEDVHLIVAMSLVEYHKYERECTPHSCSIIVGVL